MPVGPKRQTRWLRCGIPAPRKLSLRELQEYEVSLGYIASSRPAWAKIRPLVNAHRKDSLHWSEEEDEDLLLIMVTSIESLTKS